MTGTTNGHGRYELTAQLELWTDEDLINYVLDTDGVIGLEKFEITRLAQELATRFEPYALSADDVDAEALEFND